MKQGHGTIPEELEEYWVIPTLNLTNHDFTTKAVIQQALKMNLKIK